MNWVLGATYLFVMYTWLAAGVANMFSDSSFDKFTGAVIMVWGMILIINFDKLTVVAQ